LIIALLFQSCCGGCCHRFPCTVSDADAALDAVASCCRIFYIDMRSPPPLLLTVTGECCFPSIFSSHCRIDDHTLCCFTNANATSTPIAACQFCCHHPQLFVASSKIDLLQFVEAVTDCSLHHDSCCHRLPPLRRDAVAVTPVSVANAACP